MQIITSAPAIVKPATADVVFLGFRTELDFIEDDARDMFDDLTDEEIDAMADLALERDRAESGCWM